MIGTSEGANANVPLFAAAVRDQTALNLLTQESLLAQDRATLALVEGRIGEARALFAKPSPRRASPWSASATRPAPPQFAVTWS